MATAERKPTRAELVEALTVERFQPAPPSKVANAADPPAEQAARRAQLSEAAAAYDKRHRKGKPRA